MRGHKSRVVLRVLFSLSMTALIWLTGATSAVAQGQLRLEQVGAETDAAFHVVSAIIVGPTESLLWDGQYKVSDGKRLADRIAATGTRLKAIVISHADHDHYMGAMEVVKRFPNTPVYMAGATLADYNERSLRDLEAERKRPNADAPDTLVAAKLLPPTLTVDGNRLVVIENLVGDVRKPASSALWIPSLQAALVSDLVFVGIHPWLGDSDIASRAAWAASLRQIAELKPKIVVAGHKADVNALDSPDSLKFMQAYLSDFDRFMQSSASPDDLVKTMRDRYPDLKLPGLMAAGARNNFKK
jgi:glyoxylase-like metal-dependent hydrolase (beta-lactamase superfamily II)